MAIRRAVRADTASLEALWAAFMDEQATFDGRLTPSPRAGRLWAATLREAFDDGTPALWVAEASGAVVGFVVAEATMGAPVYASGAAVHVGELYVAPAHRGAGVARRLLDAVVTWAAAGGVAEVRFEVATANAASHAMVTAWGARPVAVTYVRDVTGGIEDVGDDVR